MKSTASLTFIWTPWSLAISLVVLVGVAAVCLLAWKRSRFSREQAIVESLRFLIAAVVVALLNQPEWVEEYRPDERPTIAVLYDNSASMTTRDVQEEGSTGPGLVTRQDAIKHIIDPSSWDSLRATMSIAIEPIGGGKHEEGSNLGEPLHDAPKRFDNLRAIVLASDGDWNEGPSPADAASSLRTKGIPIFTVAVGSASRLPDIELLSLDGPTFGVRGKSVRIPFSIESTLPREYVTTVTMKSTSGDEVSKEVRIRPMGRTNDWILWKPTENGDYTLSLEVPKNSDELLADNNKLSMPIAIREEKLRVLIVESLPRWEYRYLRNALSRDPGVELSCLLFHPGLNKTGGGTKDYIKSFPKGLDELGKYDVVFLGDVGVGPDQLTVEDCRLLRGIVEFQASGLVFMPGWQGNERTLLDTELADLFPVVLDDAQTSGWGSRTPSQFELTELGRRSLLTKLADTQEENIDVWQALPGFQWYAPVVRAKAGTDVLCVHKEVTNSFGRLPLLVTRTFGAGKILFMGTDGAWRWRKGVEDKYHYRFWGQVVRWMAYQRNMAKGETMRLYYSPEQPQTRQSVSLNANVMERTGEPLAKGDVTAQIKAPSGKIETIRFLSSGDEWGAFTSHYVPQEPGQHKINLSCRQTGATLETSFTVQGSVLEKVGKAARPEVLEEIARVSRGNVVAPDRLAQMIEALAAIPDPPPVIRRLQIWSHPISAAIIILLLGTFWVARKAYGLI
ncbi:hypothetical protein K2Y11_18530 [bacterium]|nr:hypothetical protein [bacterium]